MKNKSKKENFKGITLLFNMCNNLTDVAISKSVTSIGDVAFAQCTSLSTITIPNSVTIIGNGIFTGCTLSTINCVASEQPARME